MAYRIAAVDGQVHDFEDDLLWRVGRLLGLPDEDVARLREQHSNLPWSGRLEAGLAKAPVLVILHQEHSTPGRVGRLLAERGHRLDILSRRVPSETLARHAGAVIFGGPMSVNDGEDFIRREIEWLAVPLTEAVFLGLCLGAQMLAKHLGAAVWEHPTGRAEIGYFP